VEDFIFVTQMASTDSFIYPGMERWKRKAVIVTGASVWSRIQIISKTLAFWGVVMVGCARSITTN